MRPAAFFDLDRTLIDINSGMLWARHERHEGNISKRQLALAGFWTLMYHLSLIDMEAVFSSAVAFYSGQPSHELDRRTREWFMRDVEPRFRRKAGDVVEQHRKDGHPLVILSNSSCYEAAVAAETWGFDAWLANIFQTDEHGHLTGSFEAPMCYGEGKVQRAEAWARNNDVDVDHSYFYTDSYSDMPMLERVSEPRVVAPDPRLRRAAKKRGWPILQW
jgi:HAD superfamily hydrolase (TIGR01490 family)